MKRFLAWILACLILLASIGCNGPDKSSSTVQDASPTVTSTSAPETAAPAPTPEPTPDPNEQFADLDRAFAAEYLSGNLAYSMQMVEDAASLGIELAAEEGNAWGDCSLEADNAWIEACAGFSAQLDALNYDGLTASNQVAVDAMQRYFGYVAESAAYPYWNEPLDPESGVHNSIELSLSLFSIQNEADIETYFRLIDDIPAYFEAVLAYEEERFAAGYHMTSEENTALTNALARTAAKTKEHFLVPLFNTKVDALGLGEEAAAAYKEQNLTRMTEVYGPACKMLADGMEELRPEQDTKLQAACDRGSEEATAYYLYQLRMASGLEIEPYEAAETLGKWTKRLLGDAQLASLSPWLEKHEKYPVFETEDTDASLAYLKSFTEEHLAPLPEHTLTVTIPDKTISEGFAAAYIIPALDAWQENEILLPAEKDGKQLILLAHETYPGHLYQSVYQRSLGTLSLSQQLLIPTSYAEGWSQFAEYFVAANTDLMAPSSALLLHRSDMYAIMVGAYTSILVNYYGLDQTELAQRFGRDYAAYYELALRDPYVLFPYAFGYIEFMEAYEAAEETMGDSFDPSKYIKTYLDLGPGYIDDLAVRMETWAAEHVPAAAVHVSDPAANAAFEQFDEDFYRFYVTQNAVVYLNYAENNPRCAVDISEVDWSLGHYTKESWDAWHDALKDFHVKLKAIDRNALDEQYRFAYDTLDNYFTLAEEGRGFYGYASLPNGDAFTLMELMYTIVRYPMETPEDVELYFTLLNDVPRMCSELSAYRDYQAESNRYEAFSDTQQNVRIVSNTIRYLTELASVIRVQFEAVYGDDSAEAAACMERLNNITETMLVPALDQLRRSSTPMASAAADRLYYRKHNAEDYYAWRVKQQTGLSPDAFGEYAMRTADLYALLINESATWITAAKGGYLSVGSFDHLVGELSSITECYLPDVNVPLIETPHIPTPSLNTPLQRDLLQYPMDSWKKRYEEGHEKPYYYLLGRHRFSDGYRCMYANGDFNPTLAAYALMPGQAYLYSYLDEGNATLSQSILMPANYDLGWANNARLIAARHTVSQDSALMAYYMYLNQFYQTLTNYDMISRLCNAPYESAGYVGAQLAKIFGFQYSEPQKTSLTPLFPPYGIYTQTAVYTELFTAVQHEQGDAFDEKAFHTYYLSLGPSYPQLIRKAVAEHYGLDLD